MCNEAGRSEVSCPLVVSLPIALLDKITPQRESFQSPTSKSILTPTLAAIPPPLRPLVLQRIRLTLDIVDKLLQTVLSRRDGLDFSVLERLSRSGQLLVRSVLGVHVEVCDIARVRVAASSEELAPLRGCEIEV